MNIVEEFRKRVEESPLLKKFIDSIEEREWGCVYQFNGFMGCAVVQDRMIDANLLISAEDINIPELDKKIEKDEADDYLRPFRRYNSLADMVARFEYDLL